MPCAILHPPSSILVFCLLRHCADRPCRRRLDLTTADFKRQAVSLRSLRRIRRQTSCRSARLRPSTVRLDKLLQLDRGGAAMQQVRGTFTLFLTCGDRVGGRARRRSRTISSPGSPPPRATCRSRWNLRGSTRGQESPPFDATRTEDLVAPVQRRQREGHRHRHRGRKDQGQAGSGDAITVDLAAEGHFLRRRQGREPEGAGVPRPALRRLGGHRARRSTSRTTISRYAGRGNQRPVDLGQVVLIEQLNGPVSWLSTACRRRRSITRCSTSRSRRRWNRNYRGDKIRFAGRDYARGIGVHAYCKLTYALDGSFKAFRTQYALSEDAYKGKVTVRILLDDKVVHEAKDFPPGQALADRADRAWESQDPVPRSPSRGRPDTDDRTQWHIDTQAQTELDRAGAVEAGAVARVDSTADSKTGGAEDATGVTASLQAGGEAGEENRVARACARRG